MGRVTVSAVVSSIEDVYRFMRDDLAESEVRKIHIPEALIDTGATNLSLPQSMIAELGLMPFTTRRTMTADGVRNLRIFAAVQLDVNGRYCTCDVTEIPDGCPVLMGQVPLQLMDFVVDPKRHRVIGNPAHNGEWIVDQF